MVHANATVFMIGAQSILKFVRLTQREEIQDVELSRHAIIWSRRIDNTMDHLIHVEQRCVWPCRNGHFRTKPTCDSFSHGIR